MDFTSLLFSSLLATCPESRLQTTPDQRPMPSLVPPTIYHRSSIDRPGNFLKKNPRRLLIRSVNPLFMLPFKLHALMIFQHERASEREDEIDESRTYRHRYPRKRKEKTPPQTHTQVIYSTNHIFRGDGIGIHNTVEI